MQRYDRQKYNKKNKQTIASSIKDFKNMEAYKITYAALCKYVLYYYPNLLSSNETEIYPYSHNIYYVTDENFEQEIGQPNNISKQQYLDEAHKILNDKRDKCLSIISSQEELYRLSSHQINLLVTGFLRRMESGNNKINNDIVQNASSFFGIKKSFKKELNNHRLNIMIKKILEHIENKYSLGIATYVKKNLHGMNKESISSCCKQCNYNVFLTEEDILKPDIRKGVFNIVQNELNKNNDCEMPSEYRI